MENKPRPEKPFPLFVSSYLTNDFTRIARRSGTVDLAMQSIRPQVMGSLLYLVHAGYMTRQQMNGLTTWMLGDYPTDNDTFADLVCFIKLAHYTGLTQ